MDKKLEEFETKLKEVNKPEQKEILVDEQEYEEEIVIPKKVKPKKPKIVTIEEEKEEQEQESKKYADIIESMPELKPDLDYLAINKKIEAGQTLTEQEANFKKLYEQAKIKEQEYTLEQQVEFEREQREQKAKELQETVNKEYEEYKLKNPDVIATHDTEKALTMNGSENFLKVALTWLSLKKSKKKGGKIFIKVSRPKKVCVEWTTKDVRFVEFWSKNERGERVKEVTRVNEFQYTFDGTSIPVVFAIQGVAVAYDFYSQMKKDLSSEFVSGLVMEAYNLGYKDGTVLRDKELNKNSFLGSLEPFMPVIIIGGFIVLVFLMYMMYGEITNMVKEVETIKASVSAVVLR